MSRGGPRCRRDCHSAPPPPRPLLGVSTGDKIRGCHQKDSLGRRLGGSRRLAYGITHTRPGLTPLWMTGRKDALSAHGSPPLTLVGAHRPAQDSHSHSSCLYYVRHEIRPHGPAQFIAWLSCAPDPDPDNILCRAPTLSAHGPAQDSHSHSGCLCLVAIVEQQQLLDSIRARSSFVGDIAASAQPAAAAVNSGGAVLVELTVAHVMQASSHLHQARLCPSTNKWAL